ncbi:MAG TPA: phosphate ABC transporter permease subunit PstC [Candidatus Dormibacteraeota bacterium]|nr:phosphate ABC transporter permease subunit PstC [Candidatus Dormibacteraeota bacterium]
MAVRQGELRPAVMQRVRTQPLLRYATGAFALTSFGIIFLMLLFLLAYAFPAIRFNGTAFFTSPIWNIGNQYGSATVTRAGFTAQAGASFGSLVFVSGTLLSSFLAMIAAVPLSLLVALAIVYRVPASLKPLANAVVELMAGVPSVIYGLWGMIVLVPFIGNRLSPTGSGDGLLAATLILALMVVPIMVATTRDVVQAQQASIYEASMALGSTSWQAVTRAVLPSVRSGIAGSVLLAFGRALGETMAVLMVCGAAINTLPHGIFSPINTIAAVIVSQLESALTDASGMAQRSLGELALALFVITLIVNAVARIVLHGGDRSGAIG